MNREGTLNADTEGDLTDGESLADARTLAADANALEELNTLGVALDNLYVYVEGIAWAESRDVVAQLGCIYLVNEVSHCFPFQFKTEDPGAPSTLEKLTGSCLLHRTRGFFHTHRANSKFLQFQDRRASQGLWCVMQVPHGCP